MAEGWEDAEFKTKAGDIVVNKDPSGLVTGGTAALTGAAPALTALGKTGLNIGATGAAQALAAAPAYFSKPARESRQRYQDLLDAQKAGKLGWTPQQKRQMMGEALGCKTVSLISHNKLKYFLEDIGKYKDNNYVDLNNEKVYEKLITIGKSLV